MGAGQIGGIATMLDFDFNNAAGFIGKPANNLQGQYVVYYLSHAMLFCSGVLLEPHIVLTPAACVHGERYKFNVFAGSHMFLEGTGTSRTVDNICMHKGYNNTEGQCSMDNIALLVLRSQFGFRIREPESEFILNRVRYGVSYEMQVNAAQDKSSEIKCFYYGWGSRRNGFLLPLLIQLRKVEVKLQDSGKCDIIWNTDNKYLCLKHEPCAGDDLGSVIECGGYVQGMMVSRLVDRPCGVGFLDLSQYTKFIECAIDDSRDAMEDMHLILPVMLPSTPLVEQVTAPEETLAPVIPEKKESDAGKKLKRKKLRQQFG